MIRLITASPGGAVTALAIIAAMVVLWLMVRTIEWIAELRADVEAEERREREVVELLDRQASGRDE